MKKNTIITCIFVALFSIVPVIAQVSVDPSDMFYVDAQRWELQGYVEYLPQIRPYPMATIRSILTQVIENSNDTNAIALATSYYEQYFDEKWMNVSLELGATGKYGTDKTEDASTSEVSTETNFDKQAIAEPSVSGDKTFLDGLLSFGFDFGLFATSKEDDTDLLPLYTNSSHDSVQDSSSVGPIDIYLDANMTSAIGTDSIYIQGGVSRTGFGFFQGQEIVLNSTAYHSSNFIYNLAKGKWSYVHMLASIGATDNYGDELFSGKMMSVHSASYQLFPKLKIGFYEAAVWGNRLDIGYVLPTPYMAAQGISGTADNIWMGMLFDWRPLENVQWIGDFFIDDLSANDLMKLDFDTKIRAAVQTGVNYAPKDSHIQLLSLNYTIVTPYTYTHWERNEDGDTVNMDEANYQNYSNSGINMGSTLLPNSNNITFSMMYRPINQLNLKLFTSITMHGNVNESIDSDEAAFYTLSNYDTTGGYYNHAMTDSSSGFGNSGYLPSAWNSMLYLSQKHLQTTVQTGIKATFDVLTARKHKLTFSAGYTYEFIHNNGVSTQMYSFSDSSGVTVNTDSNGKKTYTYNGITYSSFTDLYEVAKDALDTVTESQYENWVNQLYDSINHYITFSVKYSY